MAWSYCSCTHSPWTGSVLLYGRTVLSTAWLWTLLRVFGCFWMPVKIVMFLNVGYCSPSRIWLVPTGFIFVCISQLRIGVTVAVTIVSGWICAEFRTTLFLDSECDAHLPSCVSACVWARHHSFPPQSTESGQYSWALSCWSKCLHLVTQVFPKLRWLY